MSAWLAMDGYAAFVWPSYLLALLTVGGLLGATIMRRRAAAKRLAELEAEDGEA